MRPLNPGEQEFWNEYLATLPEGERPRDPFVMASQAGTAAITGELIALYLEGKKSAGSSPITGIDHFARFTVVTM